MNQQESTNQQKSTIQGGSANQPGIRRPLLGRALPHPPRALPPRPLLHLLQYLLEPAVLLPHLVDLDLVQHTVKGRDHRYICHSDILLCSFSAGVLSV